MRGRGLARWPVGALLYPTRHLRWKIIAPYVALTIILAVAGAYLVTKLVGGSLDERFNNQLIEAGRVAQDSLVRRERKHLETVRSIAFTDGVAEATEGADASALAGIIEPLLANAGLERAEVIAADGTRVYGAQIDDGTAFAYTPINDNDRPSTWPFVQKVLSGETDQLGDKFTAVVHTSSQGYVLYTAGPIYNGEELAGAVLIGTRLPSFLAAAKAEALADVTIYAADGTPLGSSFAPDEDGTLDLQPGAGVLDSAAFVREDRTLFGRDYDLLYGSLLIRGEPVGYYSVGLPSSFIFSAQSATRTQMVTLFAGVMLCALLLGWLIARTITMPIFRLVTAANGVAGGDLSARSRVHGPDEIGALGTAFDAMAERLQRQHLATVRALTSAIDARDPYTMGHSLRVGQLAVEIGTELGLSQNDLQHLEIGGYLHDIGKIGVRDAVLLKPGALDADERAAIERHPTIGLQILEPVDLAPEVIEFVGGHHEKLNGVGYPEHLHEHELSVFPRIAAVADIFDALTTDRPYRAGMTPAKGLSILYKEADDGQLDRDVVVALERVLPRWRQRLKSEPSLQGFRIEQQTAKPAPAAEEIAA
jgi:putative nucleotidyltransferase with HDIG domain